MTDASMTTTSPNDYRYAANRFVTVGKIRFAYRELGRAAASRWFCSITGARRWTISTRASSTGLPSPITSSRWIIRGSAFPAERPP